MTFASPGPRCPELSGCPLGGVRLCRYRERTHNGEDGLFGNTPKNSVTTPETTSSTAMFRWK